MTSIREIARSFFVDDEGAAASEYAVLLSLLIVVIASAVSLFDIRNAFSVLGGFVRTATGL